MNDITIRLALINDIPQLLPLMAQLEYETNLATLTNRFRKFISTEGYGVAVAIESEQVVGFVAWSKSTPFVVDKTRFHIEGIAVDERYRGSGIGKKLMQFAEDFAKSFGDVIIDLTSGLRRAKDGTHEFYSRLGYKNEGHMAKLYLRKELS